MTFEDQAHRCRSACEGFPNQDAEVLAGSDKVVLNLLTPQTTPSCAFETMRIGGVSETAFHQVLASATIPQGCPALALSPGLRHFVLAIKALNPSAALSLGALRTQCALITSAGFGHILISLFLRPVLPTFHLLACRTPVSVSGRVVNKSIFSEKFGPLLCLILRTFEIGHMRLNPIVHTV
jgi:hypothetical protein